MLINSSQEIQISSEEELNKYYYVHAATSGSLKIIDASRQSQHILN